MENKRVALTVRIDENINKEFKKILINNNETAQSFLEKKILEYVNEKKSK